MTFTVRGGTIAVSLALLLTVITQLFYVFVVSAAADGGDTLRRITWTLEIADYTLIAAAALALAAHDRTMPLVWSLIALSGIVNLIQVAMGLAMFGPAQEATEQVPQLFGSILAGAFFLYFHGKALLALAAVAVGLAVLARDGAVAKALGGLTLLAGVAAAGLNGVALAAGMDWTYPAGASGTLATALLAVSLMLVARQHRTG